MAKKSTKKSEPKQSSEHSAIQSPTSSPSSKSDVEMSMVSETHWDREWYSTFQEFRFRLVKMMDCLLDILDSTPGYQNFLLDGQIICVEDYLEIRPEMRSKIVKYCKDGRLSVGPAYILPDMYLISGEAHIRNYLLGQKIANELGVNVAKVGYHPDAFGHPNQMPQILQGFGIDNYVFTRGMGDNAETLGSDFWWDSPAGHRVFCQQMPLGYGNAENLLGQAHFDTDPNEFKPLDEVYLKAKERVLKTKALLLKYSHGNRILLMNGVDHLQPERSIPDFNARFNKEGEGQIIHRSLEEHCKLQIQDLKDKNLPVWKGEFHFGKQHPILTDTNSSRMYMKQTNQYIQTLLEEWADPMNALATIMGAKDENPGYLWLAWKTLLQNHPHDSCCSCSVDEVHREGEIRFLKAEEIANIQIKRALADLASHINFYPPNAPMKVETLMDNIPVIVFNSLPYESMKPAEIYLEFKLMGEEMVEPPETFDLKDPAGKIIPYSWEPIQITPMRKVVKGTVTFKFEFIARVPAMGYAVYTLCPSTHEKQPEFPLLSDLKYNKKMMENGFVKLEFAPNGTFTLTEKTTGRTFPNCNLFIDEADMGDEYDFIPLKNDKFLTTKNLKADIQLYRQTPYSISFEVILSWCLPTAMNENRTEREKCECESDDACDCDNDLILRSEITLFAEDPIVHISTGVHNSCEDHRLRVIFPAPFKNDFVQAEEDFWVMDRSLVRPKGEGWCQKPSKSDHMNGFVSFGESDGSFQMSLFNKGMPNYEILPSLVEAEIKSPCIAQTLIRAVGWLGRPEGGAGPSILTPDAQLQDDYVFEYGLFVSPGNWEKAHVTELCHQWQVPLGAIIPLDYWGIYNVLPFSCKPEFYGRMGTPKALYSDCKLPAVQSFINLAGPGMIFSTLKTAEDGKGLIFRFWNSSHETKSAQITSYKKTQSVTLVKLDESALEDQSRISSNMGITKVSQIAPGEVISLRFFFK